MKIWIFLFLSFSVSLFPQSLLEELSFGKDALYQDIIVNGETLFHGDRECEERYQAIKQVLDLYDRPITTIDIGANNGYFSIRAAQEYGSTAVMVDMQDRLEKICEYNTDLSTLICLNKQLTTQDLKELNRREHFDVLILFHVLHHIAEPDSWEEFLNEVFKLADNVIIQTPPANDGFIVDKPNIPAIERYLLSLPTGKVIGSFTRQSEEIRDHMIWFCLKPKDLHSSLYSKPRKQGISLATFRKLHGRYPSKEHIKAMREKLPFYKRYFKGAITVQGDELN